ncbi:hypothetical protein HYS97_02615 [Candidatus Daviesbacteria bacterium]|nr:hypothetical protein [Candidatus Daviesbacteria bacterium]
MTIARRETADSVFSLRDAPEAFGRKRYGKLSVVVRTAEGHRVRRTAMTWIQRTSMGQFVDVNFLGTGDLDGSLPESLIDYKGKPKNSFGRKVR